MELRVRAVDTKTRDCDRTGLVLLALNPGLCLLLGLLAHGTLEKRLGPGESGSTQAVRKVMTLRTVEQPLRITAEP